MVLKAKHPRPKMIYFLLFLISSFLMGSVSPVLALNFSFGEDVTLDVDTQLKYETAVRLKDPDPALTSEGNNNFESGDLINNRFSTVIDVDLQYKNIGAFVRPRAYYDFVYDDDKFSSKTKDLHRDKVEILDAFVYGDTTVGGQGASLRVGRQVVSWGESLYIGNGISSGQNPVDATAATKPDVELKELFLPTGQVFGKIDLGSAFSLAGYYKWEWDKTRIDERGAYWNTTDLLDEAGLFNLPLPPGEIDRAGDNEPTDSNQWGVNVRYVAEELNATEFGLYYINYHEFAPLLNFNPLGGTPDYPPGFLDALVAGGIIDPATAAGLGFADASSYNLDYQEDINLIGFSFSAEMFDWNVSGEASYRIDYPVMVVDDNPTNLFGFTYEEADALQAQVSFIKYFADSWIWESASLAGEVAFNQIYNNDKDLVNDDFAMGYRLVLTPNYFNILDGLDLSVPISYSGNPAGDSSMAASFTEGSDVFGITFKFIYQQVYEMAIGYTTFIGDADDNSRADRDNISLLFKYTF